MPNAQTIRAIIEAATHASSGHNSQPWQFAVAENHITISPDFSRRLPAIDPDDRELFISLGCAAENLSLAAAHFGYATDTDITDNGSIRLTLHKQPENQRQPENEALFAQIPRRQTNRAAYNGNTIPQAELDSLIATQQSDSVSLHPFARNTPEFAALTEAVAAGNRAQMHDLAFKAELLSWIRFNRRHSNTTRDGLSNAVMGAPNLPAWLSRPIIKTMLNERRQNRSDRQSFAGYAYGQIKKARGLNKKISNPMSSEKKSILDFCHIIEGRQTVPLQYWLTQRGMEQKRVGLIKIAHARELYALFYDADGTLGYHGIAPKPEATTLSLSTIPEGETPLAHLSFNQDGYSSYCREYASYQQWLTERNETRYQGTQAHGQGYDAKNMMHTFRLLETARDIALHGEIRPRRPNRDELLAIKRGSFPYDELLARAETLINEVENLFAQSDLPEAVNTSLAINALVEIRTKIYG